MPQVRQRTFNAVIAPVRVFPGHADSKLRDCFRDGRSSSGFPAVAVVPVHGHQLPVPAQDSIWRNDGHQLGQRLSSKNVTFESKPSPLIVVQEDAAFAKLFPEHAVFGLQILDGALLLAIELRSHRQDNQVPRLQKKLKHTIRHSFYTKRVSSQQPREK